MLIQGNCKKCGKQIGILQYSDHYFCEKDYGEYICIECYENGQKKCLKCNGGLTFHNSADTIQWQKDNNIMF